MTVQQLRKKLATVDRNLEVFLALDEVYDEFAVINEVVFNPAGILLTPKEPQLFDYFATEEVKEMPRL